MFKTLFLVLAGACVLVAVFAFLGLSTFADPRAVAIAAITFAALLFGLWVRPRLALFGASLVLGSIALTGCAGFTIPGMSAGATAANSALTSFLSDPNCAHHDEANFVTGAAGVPASFQAKVMRDCVARPVAAPTAAPAVAPVAAPATTPTSP